MAIGNVTGRTTHAIKIPTSDASATTAAAVIMLAITKAEADQASRNWRAASILDRFAEILTAAGSIYWRSSGAYSPAPFQQTIRRGPRAAGSAV